MSKFGKPEFTRARQRVDAVGRARSPSRIMRAQPAHDGRPARGMGVHSSCEEAAWPPPVVPLSCHEAPLRETVRRRLPIGAEPLRGGGVHFRVWAPRRSTVAVVLEDEHGGEIGEHALEREAEGYHSGRVTPCAVGARYRYALDDAGRFPDPASRWQPDGPHGASVVVDPGTFVWSDTSWPGVRAEGQVLYELHVGTFTAQGTWRSAMHELPSLSALGVTTLELMPVAEFPGRFGWGYDGVDLFAPFHGYGEPDDFRRFVDRAHQLGLGVILDVVYNHLGPDGNYLPQYAESYFSRRHVTEWGSAPNFDDPGCEGVRELVVANAGYWIDEFHLDGLRLDATQSIHDESPTHVIAQIVARVRAAAGSRRTLVVGENEPQQTALLAPVEGGGCGLDALWNDDFHHSAMVALTGRDEAYYTDYAGRAQEFVSSAKYGFLYQGQYYAWQEQRRGSPTFGLLPHRFVNFVQNHDQVANSFAGARAHLLTSPGRLRAMTALLLLAPQTPMLFQGQEFAASSPFLYFADHSPSLAPLVAEGRAEFLAQFPSLVRPEMRDALPDPADPHTFARCKLDSSERETHGAMVALHRDLLALRRGDPVFAGAERLAVDGAVLSEAAFVLRLFGAAGDDRLLIVNLGSTVHLRRAPEPLLAPPPHDRWRVLWFSEERRYGGLGVPPIETRWENWTVPGETAVVLAPRTTRTASATPDTDAPHGAAGAPSDHRHRSPLHHSDHP